MAASLTQQQPPTLRAIYPALLARQFSGDNPLEPRDKATIQAFRIRNPISGHTRFAGPAHLAMWMGLEADQAERLTARFACAGIFNNMISGGTNRS